MKRYAIVAAVALSIGASAVAQPAQQAPTRRALVIGIDKYEPQSQGHAPPKTPAKGRIEWRNLQGAVADALVMKRLLVERFGFPEAHIDVLTDAQATRLAILEKIVKLTTESKKGDIAVVYFAGHGSQVVNSKSPEPDRLDETIVPADSWRGAFDLRDKELASALLNPLLDKGVTVTAIFDSCHSGSIGRGPPPEAEDDLRSRWLPFDPRDVADGREIPEPEERGAVIFSAAQQDELAWEAKAEGGARRGRFSLALDYALRTAQPDESAENVFRRVKAIMAGLGDKAQDPVLAGLRHRTDAAFISGGPAAKAPTTVAVIDVKGVTCTLQGGVDLFLSKGTELVLADTKLAKAPRAPRVVITEVESITRSQCKVIAGDASLLKRQLLRVDKWGAPELPLLNVHVEPAAVKPEALDAVYKHAQAAARAAKLEWVDDPGRAPAGNVLFHEGGTWRFVTASGESKDLGAAPDAKALGAAFASATVKRVFVQLPPTKALAEALEVGLKRETFAITRSARKDAHYVLAGRLTPDGRREYAWVHASLDSTGSTLPARTDWTAESEASTLDGAAQALARIHAWLNVNVPDGDEGGFPWRLTLAPTGTKEEARRLEDGGRYDLLLTATEKPKDATPRFVYVFSIDRLGAMTLLFPKGTAGAVENRFPANKTEPQQTYLLPRKRPVKIAPPLGRDTFVLVTTSEQLTAPQETFNAPAVMSRGQGVEATRGGLTIFDAFTGRTRGTPDEAPAAWSVQRVVLESVPASSRTEANP